MNPAPTRRDTVTDDGWRIALHHFAAEGEPRRHPVVCCHGLGANHVAFDLAPEASIARHLAGRGYDVYVVDLRGHGASERGRYGWAFDHYLLHDVPAVLRQVGPAHWIGHSMGGILALAHLACGGADLASVVTVGSAIDYSHSPSGFHRLVPFRALLERLPSVPVRAIARLSGALAGRWATPFERFNVWPSNTDPALWRVLCERGFDPVSPPVMAQLASAMLPGGLRSLDGVPYAAGLAASTTPVLALAGSRDAQCPPDAVARTVEILGATGQLRVLGAAVDSASQPLDELPAERDHYGHFDMLMGRRVRDEVFGHIDRWIDDHDFFQTAE